MKVGVKGSKLKNCFLVLSKNEVKKADRKSDVYVFGRVDLPSDHLFRIIRNRGFFKPKTTIKKSRNYLMSNDN